MTIALIDGDSVAYRPAASCEPTKKKLERESLDFAIARCNDLMHRILHDTNAMTYELYIGGGKNFRHTIDPTYKANRDDMVRPMWLEDVREYLVTTWKAHVVEGIEAEDSVGIANNYADETAVICAIDKDLNQLPGHHYNYVTGEREFITPRQGWANFYTQLIMGDRADNIMGYDGKMRQKVPKFLQSYVDAVHSATSDFEMFEIVREIYELGDEAMLNNARLLYIWREDGDEYSFPTIQD